MCLREYINVFVEAQEKGIDPYVGEIKVPYVMYMSDGKAVIGIADMRYELDFSTVSDDNVKIENIIRSEIFKKLRGL